MPESLDVRSYQKDDEKKILELFSISFNGRQMSLPYWRWRFQDNPSGGGVIQLSWAHDVIVAHYAVTTLSMCIDGRDCLAGLSGTTMTHPDYRGRGLFSILARRTYREMTNRSMTMVWGFPNSMIHRARISELNWVDIYEIPTFRMVLDSYLRPINASSTMHVSEFMGADERFDRFWTDIHKDYDIIVRRDRTYINWRYFSNPLEKYRLIAYVTNEEIKGYAVFKRYQDEMQVVDLLVGKNDVEIGELLIQFVISQAVSAKAKSISLWLNVIHPLHNALEKIGFRPGGPVNYFGGLALSPDSDRSLYDFRKWYFTMSDSDVF